MEVNEGVRKVSKGCEGDEIRLRRNSVNEEQDSEVERKRRKRENEIE